MNDQYSMTAEAVSEGHPDKVADQISDAILDSYLRTDPDAHVACECLVSRKLVVVAGEITAAEHPEDSIPNIVRDVFGQIGYDRSSLGFDLSDLQITQNIQKQSSQISQGVTHEDGQLGAGDQGVMFGFATNETPEYMPLTVSIPKRIIRCLADLRQAGDLPWLMPDAKCQVTTKYTKGSLTKIETLIISTQHSPTIQVSDLRSSIQACIVAPVFSELKLKEPENLVINPAGPFTQGGPGSDTGLTGRKIAVDSYGPFCPIGGGAFSGKDATKVDRSGAYMARYVAKNVVAAKLARQCTVQLAYAIGCVDPVSISISTDGTGMLTDGKLTQLISESFEFTPAAIINCLQLRSPIYLGTARHGHFGFGVEHLPWEMTDRAEYLRHKAGDF